VRGKKYIVCNLSPGFRSKQTNENIYTFTTWKLVISVTTMTALTLEHETGLTVLISVYTGFVFDQLLIMTVLLYYLYETYELMSELQFICS
jgi:hypothetical protein